MSNKFIIGDVVYLNSGSPPMVVIFRTYSNLIKVRWITRETGLCEASFPESCLTKEKTDMKE
jgi:uncharacterized protein YodC (DUF2158 family)